MHTTSRSTRSRPRHRSSRLGAEALEAREVPASLSGRVFLDYDNSGTINGPDTGLARATVGLSGGGLTTPRTTTSDAQAKYTFDNLPAGVYSVGVSRTATTLLGTATVGTAGGTLTAPPSMADVSDGRHVVHSVSVAEDTTATGHNFALIPLVSTDGTVYEDVNGNGVRDAGEPGIPGVKVSLSGYGNGPGAGWLIITPMATTTDANGDYRFTGLRPGTYSIREIQPAGYSDGTEQNGTPAAGGVFDDRFQDIDLTKSAAPSGGFNFAEVRGGTLSGVVYSDVNDDGTRATTGEPGIAGVRVRLTGTDDQGRRVEETTTTGADGSYTFDHLGLGTYAVREVQPAKFHDGKETAGSAGGNVTVNDRITDIPFTAGAVLTGYSFGERAWADLRLTHTASAPAIRPGGTVALTYTVTNVGSAAAPAAAIQFRYGGLTLVSNSIPSRGTFDPTTRTWTVGDLPAGASQTLQLILRGPAVGTYQPSAWASTTATEVRAGNNAVAWTVTVGVPPPAPSRGPGWFAPLAAFNTYPPLTRLWLVSRLFG